MILQRTGGSHAVVYIFNYGHAHFMTIGKFDTLFSFFNLSILQVGQVEHAMKFINGNTFIL